MNYQGKTLDDLATIVDEKLCPFSNELLIEFIDVSLKLATTTDLLSKTRRQLKKLIQRHCEEDILDNEELEEATKRGKLLNILNLVDVYNPPTPFSGGEDDKPDDDSALVADAQKTVQQGRTSNDEKVAVGCNLTSGWLREMEALSKTNMLRREFKVRGQIGEPGQRDKLTYVSLMHQIRDAQAAGYKEEEIVSSVINCMVPSLTLRGVLATTPNLSLAQFLEAHFNERSAEDLCDAMTSLIRSTDESVYAYVMRTIEIRQKVLLASQKASGKGAIGFAKDLVMKLFLRTLERGIISQYVVQEIRHLLKSSSTTDEELISAVTKASALEKERSDFQSRNKKQVKVFEVISGSRSGSVSKESTITKLVSSVDKLT